MRTSRASKDTAKVLQALSPPARRQTRASDRNVSALSAFAYNGNPTANAPTIPSVKSESTSGPPSLSVARSDDESSLSSVDTADIEDLLEPPSKRRKRNTSPDTARVIKKSPRTSRKAAIKDEPDQKPVPKPKARRMPARKIRDADGSVKVEPPSNWEIMYDTVKKMREDNPTAPVDTMGCAELYWRASAPQDRRFQTLIALMLSSQTKDTVTAVAMQRLHTELGPESDATCPELKEEEAEEEVKIKLEDNADTTTDTKQLSTSAKDSTLKLTNILAVSPERLNELIRTVGFHNNKTKYIKATALLLRDNHDGDIPSTPEGLMALPGVGPKMAYLCLSAAWGKHEGIGVDVHVHRITNLWGWNKTKTPEETRMALQSWLPHEKWHEINKLLVGLGQTVCLPVKRRCGDCYLFGKGLCMSEVKGSIPTVGAKREDGDEPKVKIEAV
ncbi:hypothetical protein PENANT_c047G09336 [Penicillium antarcticum]|uniref:Endonuclease III homolog n=1 Tax=Penicillium antarcticum TaxID=416450 RepID=A0A1V6PRQ1_9EURO|nr:uncharacterized protein N7508_005025 [Penicillium antarcticum]KAJ5306010.1 hypothetical protein N7508_005025 [Penicillium antarcticum]OQD79591.1 hypothetical protein PENANT_c047G09336 [Penicillium antarcticum]